MSMIRLDRVNDTLENAPGYIMSRMSLYHTMDEDSKSWLIVAFVQYIYAKNHKLGVPDGRGSLNIKKKDIKSKYSKIEILDDTFYDFGAVVLDVIMLRNLLCHECFNEDCIKRRVNDMFEDTEFIKLLAIHGFFVPDKEFDDSYGGFTEEELNDNDEPLVDNSNPLAAALAKMTGN